MAKVSKVVIPQGIHQAPAGRVHATPSRVQHWATQINAMLKDLKLPVSWGHQPKATPADPEKTKADAEYWQSKLNAGYIESAKVNDAGALEIAMDLPGCELKDGQLLSVTDGKPVVIEEVSAAIKPEFKDGKGRSWKDAIVHVALTTLPVVGQQPAFQPLSLAGTLCLGSASLLYELANEKPDEKPPEKPDDKPADKKEPSAAPFTLEECLRLLKEVKGIVLPENTTAENFFERLCVALNALKSDEKEEEAPVIPSESKKTEEQLPDYMMSLHEAAKTNPVIGKLLESAKESRKHKRAALLASLKSRGLPPATHKELETAIGAAVELSFTADGQPVDDEIDRTLAWLDKSLPKLDGLTKKTVTLGTSSAITEQPKPAASDPKAIAEEQLKNTRRPMSCATN